MDPYCHYAQIGDWNTLTEHVIGNAPQLIEKGETDRLLGYLAMLPDAVRSQNPWLLYWQGACLLSRQFGQAHEAFEASYRLFAEKGDPAGLFLSWAGAVDTIVYEWADFSRLDSWIDRLAAIRKQHPEFPSVEVEVRVSASMLGVMMFHLPQHPEIDAWAGRVFHLAQGCNDPAQRIMIGNQLALFHLWWTGNNLKLSLVMDLLRPPKDAEELSPLVQIIWLTLRGLEEWSQGRSATALQTFTRGVAVSETSGVHIWDFMLYFMGAVAYLDEEDINAGARCLDELFTRIDRSQHLNVVHYRYLKGWHAVLAGDPQLALEQVQPALAIAEQLGGPFTLMAICSALAQVQFFSGERSAAWSSLERAIDLSRHINAPLPLFRNLMSKAYFAMETDDEPLCLDALRNALALGRERRYFNHSWWLREPMARLCLKALEAGIETDYVRELISRRRLFPQKPPRHVENWPWPIRLQTLGSFVIFANGKPVVFSGKLQKKPLELLKALVALGGRESRGGQLMDLLWPEADGDTARTSLKTTLHRLRQILGMEEAILVSEGRLTLNERYVWTDVGAFDHLLQQAQYSAEAGDEKRAVALSEKAVDLYAGPFLAEEDKPWVEPLRGKLSDKLVHHLITLGRISADAGDFRESVAWYERGLEADDCNEFLYQELMHCYRSMGLHSRAIAVYERCRNTLASGMNIAPAAATEKLYCQILAEGKIS